MFERFTDGAKMVMSRSRQEALGLDHDRLGSEHFLLAIAHDSVSACEAATILTNLGIDLEGVRAEVGRRLVRGSAKVTAGQLPFTELAKRVLELSMMEALGFGGTELGSQHVLLGILKSGDGVAASVLGDLGVRYEDVHAKALALGPDTAR